MLSIRTWENQAGTDLKNYPYLLSFIMMEGAMHAVSE